MVEIRFIKARHIEIPAIVFAVAFETAFAPGLRRSMIALPPAEQALYFRMAIQAFFIGYLLSQRVALRTIGYSFQAGMRTGQGAGRKLRVQSGRKQRDCPKNHIQDAWSHFLYHKVN